MKETDAVIRKLSEALNLLAKSLSAVASKMDEYTREKTNKKNATEKSTSKPPKPKRRASKNRTQTGNAKETVLHLICNSPDGIALANLQKKSGLKNTQIHRIVYRLKKEGKIQSPSKGIYAPV